VVPTAATASVRIRTQSGPVRVTGWPRNEVKVSAASPEWLRVHSGDDHISIRADGPGAGALDVQVPGGARVDVEVVSGTVTVRDVGGTVRASSVEGQVEVNGTAREVEAHTIAGSVDVKSSDAAKSVDVRASSVSGPVRVRTAGTARVWAKSVSGGITLSGGAFERAQLRSVSGPLTFEGRPVGDGRFELHTHSGSIDVTLPSGASPSLDVHTVSGQVVKGQSGAAASKTVLTLSTFSGSIRVKP
jgi:DUF4097 and DUF4098 domain-containing protein YvlB